MDISKLKNTVIKEIDARVQPLAAISESAVRQSSRREPYLLDAPLRSYMSGLVRASRG